MGLLLRVQVHPANICDREGAKPLLSGIKEKFPAISLIWADQGYGGSPLAEWVQEQVGCVLQITKRSNPPITQGIEIQPKRWLVERTLAWISRNRRLSRDYEELPDSEEALVSMAMVRLMAKRLSA